MKKSISNLFCLSLILILTGCGTSKVSRDISESGDPEEVIFPDAAKQAWKKEGTFPDEYALSQIQTGLTKDQLYRLIGPPHFREGFFGVQEWDYIFNFRSSGGNEIRKCQYKVVFDKNHLAQRFFWLPESCKKFE